MTNRSTIIPTFLGDLPLATRVFGTIIPTFRRDRPLTTRAFAYYARLRVRASARARARELHAGHRRESDAAPLILHPLEVAALLHNTGHSDTVVAAGVLHDTLEGTDARADDIAARFGDDVARLVTALTEDPAIASFDERKAALRRQIAAYGADATAVYAVELEALHGLAAD